MPLKIPQDSGKRSGAYFKVGLFILVGLSLVIGASIYVNNVPYWWRSCQFAQINVSDATGLKVKSPVKSLGVEIGYLRSVALHENRVTLGMWITAPVEVTSNSRAFVRGEGLLGDKFIELKPVKFVQGKKKK